MKIEIRLYKQHDADLIALAANGYPIASMMRDAILGYANGNPVNFYIDEPSDVDFNVLKTFRTRFVIPQSEEKALYLIQGIKHRFRNVFCKMILRDALIHQNMVVFFSSGAFNTLYQMNGYAAQFRNPNSFLNVIPCSSYKQEQKQKTFGQDIVANPVTSMLPKKPNIISIPVAPAPSNIHVQNIPVYNMQPPIIGNNAIQPNVLPTVASVSSFEPVHQEVQSPVEEVNVAAPALPETPSHTEPVETTSEPTVPVQDNQKSDNVIQNLNDNSESAILNNIKVNASALSALDMLMGNAFE